MLKKIVSGILLVMMVLSLAGCVKRADTSQQKPQQEPVQGDNILDNFIIEKRDDDEAEEKEERISLSLEDLKKKPEQEEEPANEEEPEEEEPEEEPEEESGSKDGNSYEYYRGQVAGDSDLGEPIEFDMDSTPVFEDSSAAK